MKKMRKEDKILIPMSMTGMITSINVFVLHYQISMTSNNIPIYRENQ